MTGPDPCRIRGRSCFRLFGPLLAVGCVVKPLPDAPFPRPQWMWTQATLDATGRPRLLLSATHDGILVDGESHTSMSTGGGVEVTWRSMATGDLCISGPIRCGPLPAQLTGTTNALVALTPETVLIEDSRLASWKDGEWTASDDWAEFSPGWKGERVHRGPGLEQWTFERPGRTLDLRLPEGTFWAHWLGDTVLYGNHCARVWGEDSSYPVCTGLMPFPVGDAWGLGLGNTVAVIDVGRIRFVGPTPGSAFLTPAEPSARPRPHTCPTGPALALEDWILVPTREGAVAERSCPQDRPVWTRYKTCDGTLLPLDGDKGACLRLDVDKNEFVVLGRFAP